MLRSTHEIMQAKQFKHEAIDERSQDKDKKAAPMKKIRKNAEYKENSRKKRTTTK